MGEIAEFNPKSDLPDEFEYVDLESVVGTEMVFHRTEKKASAPSRAQRVAKTGDVFFQTVRPYQRNNYLFSMPYENYVFSTGYAQMRPKINAAFLMCFLQTESFVQNVLDNCTGTSYPAINSSDLSNLKISLPILKSEQSKIGKLISNLDHLITLHQRKLFEAKNNPKNGSKNFFRKIYQKLYKFDFNFKTYDWEQRKVSDVSDRYDNLRVPVAANLRIKGSTPYYGANGIQDYVEGYTHDGEFVLVAEDGANDLKNYPVNYVNGRVWVNNHAHVLQAKESIADNRFIGYAISRANIESVLVGGGRAKLNAEVLIDISLKIPTKKEQVQISSFISSLDNLITLHQREVFYTLKYIFYRCCDTLLSGGL